MKILRTLLRAAIAPWKFLFYDGLPDPNRVRWMRFSEQRRKDFSQHGSKSCPYCSTKIPGNKHCCGSCYKRKFS